MSESVIFDLEKFNQSYPELNATAITGQWAFDMACLLLNNTQNSIICCCCKREDLLYLLTAHILFLKNRGVGNVGTLNSAHEGSVSVGFGSNGKLTDGFLGQTQYGILFLEATKQFKSGFYVP